MPTVLVSLATGVPENAVWELRGKSHVPALKAKHVTRDEFPEMGYRGYPDNRSVVTPDEWKLILRD